MLPSSLRQRLLLLASILLVIGFGVIAWVLDSSFRQGTQNGLEEKVQLQILTLLAAAEQDGENILMPESLPDPRFNQPSSGLYGVIVDNSGNELWRSYSAIAVTFDTQLELTPGKPVFGTHTTIDNESLFYAAMGTIWEQDNIEFEFGFIVLEDMSAVIAENSGFRSTLWLLLLSVAAGLLVIQWFVLHWGLSPLTKIAAELKQIEQSDTVRLDGHYPDELQSLASNINQLLLSEQNQRENYKNRMADLAHSLKTPLAILRGLDNASDIEKVTIIQEQTARMNQIVEYQLKRAVLGSQQLSIRNIDIEKPITQLVGALEKVYLDKAVKVDLHCNDANFKGDESDFMEIAGNLVDNAFKYGVSQVRVTAKNDKDTLIFIVEDDGAGIDENDAERILNRGTRLDTTEAGQGIGLASVSELVRQYQGSLTITRSELLGAKFTLII